MRVLPRAAVAPAVAVAAVAAVAPAVAVVAVAAVARADVAAVVAVADEHLGFKAMKSRWRRRATRRALASVRVLGVATLEAARSLRRGPTLI